MSQEYFEISELAEHKNLNEKKLIKYCIDAKIHVFTLILSSSFNKSKPPDECEVVFIDNQYMAIPIQSLQDYVGLASGDMREATIPFLYKLNLPTVNYLPLNLDKQVTKFKFTQLKLYINCNDITKLNNHISESNNFLNSETSLTFINDNEVIHSDMLINKTLDVRHDIDLQDIANDFAKDYMNKNNGKIPLKKTIAYQISKTYPKFGKSVTIERRIKQTWK